MGLIFLLFFMGLGLKPERIAANRSAVLVSGMIDLNVNMIIGFIAAYLLGFSLTESLIVASAFYISSTAMAITSLIENRKLMLREAETIIWLMVFEDLVLIIFLAILSAGDQNLVLFLVKILGVLAVLYALAHYGKEFLISILDRDDELPIIFTFAAVLTTASVLHVPGSSRNNDGDCAGSCICNHRSRCIRAARPPVQGRIFGCFFCIFRGHY